MDIETNKIDFLSLIQDESFIDLVHKTENPDELLQELIKQDPKNGESIKYAFEFIRINKGNRIKMDQVSYDRILRQIKKQQNTKPFSHHYRHIPLFIRVAAIIIVILSIGSLVVYQKFAIDPLTQFAHKNIADDSQSMIVLSDGSSQVLKKSDSFIDYNSTDGEVIVKNKGQEEIIRNIANKEEAILNQVVVPFGQRQKILLSDGTLVQLNAGSRLTFPANFTGKTREVFLKGEGFFEVSKNVEMPFIVKTDQIDIKVLGTTFNISAYENEQYVTTVLLEGKVNVVQKDKLFANEKHILSPGQGCFYSVANKHSVVKEVNVNDYILWKSGLYKFSDMPLRDVVSRVCRYYNLNIQIGNEHLSNVLVSGKLVLSDDATQVMQYLSKTVEGQYKISPEGIFIINTIK